MYRDPVVRAYAAQARGFPKLSREEELELAVAWKSRASVVARDRLLGSQLRAVTAIARKLHAYAVSPADLIAEGNIGLLIALDKFDPALGYRFGTYAAFWIRARMINHVLASWSIVQTRSGVLRSKTFFRLRRERSRLLAQLGDPELVNAALATRLGLSADALRAMLQRLDRGDVSLDFSTREDGAPMVETLESPSVDQEQQLMQHERQAKLKQAVKHALAGLDARERRIVRERLMADDAESLSLAELGRRMGISRERARQLEHRARRKLALRLEHADLAAA